ncbi:hypothetical protein F751_4953 [Auxenochlorella protothecoides]|uniref:Uncharacterized protein n=2 Tax=Auxenochlorella protothecoides TaxID=3075 RepID=A0A087SMD8_AUXPR|nr:hypothetical protein F751_4953 [Auxenochlorella protothecoides]KFM26892.1 hypothetical protein F751_4953 [Auxenochlorella protothecoides]
MDGLLLNTEEFYTVVQQNIAADYGKEFTWELKLCVGADQCLTSLTHFVPEEWGLPPYDNVDAREG